MATLLLASALIFQTATARLQTGTLSGFLRTGAGIPMEGVRVAVEPVESVLGADVLESIGLTDKEGRFALENIAPGRYRLLTGRPGSSLYHPGVTERELATTIVVVAGETTAIADMVFVKTTIAGRVVDSQSGLGKNIDSLTLCCTAAPLPGETYISYFGGVPLGRFAASMEAMNARVGADGNFVFEGITPGIYYLQAFGPGVVPMIQPIIIGQNNVTGLEVRVTGGVEVRGDIADRLKEPVISGVVSLKPHPENALFEITNTSVARRSVLVADSSINPNLMTTPQDVILARLRADNKPRTANVTPLGTFSFPGVLPGKYTAELNAPGGIGYSREIEVGTREPLVISFDVPFVQVKGRILVHNGTALPTLSGSVRFVSSDSSQRVLFGFPDDLGRFSLLMTSGEYRLFTENLNVDRFIQSISDGPVDLTTQPFVVDGARSQEIRITIEP